MTSGFVPGLERIINRENLYNAVLSMYQEDGVDWEYPLFIKYKDEKCSR